MTQYHGLNSTAGAYAQYICLSSISCLGLWIIKHELWLQLVTYSYMLGICKL